MTVYVGTDFLLALVGEADWVEGSATDLLEEYDVETSAFSYLELLLAAERYEFDAVPLVANLLDLVPVRDEAEKRTVLRAVTYYEDEGLSPFEAFHAATAAGRGADVISFERDYGEVGVEQVPLDPAEGE